MIDTDKRFVVIELLRDKKKQFESRLALLQDYQNNPDRLTIAIYNLSKLVDVYEENIIILKNNLGD